MKKPTLKSILSKNKSQKHIYVEELDERFCLVLSQLIESLNLFIFSYYIMDGSKKRVTFDDDNDMANDQNNDNIDPPTNTLPILNNNSSSNVQ